MYALSAFLTKFPCLWYQKGENFFHSYHKLKFAQKLQYDLEFGGVVCHIFIINGWNWIGTQTSPLELVISTENQHFLSVAWTKFVYSCEDQSVRHIINIPRSPKSQQILKINQWERRKQDNGPITDLETVNSLFSSRCWCLLLSPIVT